MGSYKTLSRVIQVSYRRPEGEAEGGGLLLLCLQNFITVQASVSKCLTDMFINVMGQGGSFKRKSN